MRRIVILLTLFVLATTVLADQKEDLDRATRLRDEATADWKAGKYAEAAEKLREADAIYQRQPGDHASDRAVVLRALAYDESKLGHGDEILRIWETLSALAFGKADLRSEVFDAYVAYLDYAKGEEDLGRLLEKLGNFRKLALRQRYPGIAAQVLHDEGYQAFKRGDKERAIGFYRQAADERREIGDDLGLAWSSVNLADAYYNLAKIDEALDPLLAAYRTIHERGIIPPQAAMARNLDWILRDLAARDEWDARTGKWLSALSAIALRTRLPKVIPAGRILRLGMMVDPSTRALRKLVKSDLSGLPAEVRADLVLRAARLAVKGGASRDAAKWLKKLDVGAGLAHPRLEARRLTALALATSRKKDFVKLARAAAAAWRDLGDRAGREAALDDLVRAASEHSFDKDLADLTAEASELLRSRKPGGEGTSAQSGGNNSGYAKLGLHDPVFSISVRNGKILLEDLVAKQKMEITPKWKPQRRGLNGCVVQFFGGWFVVENLSYGSCSFATGVSGTTTLDELRNYRPVPAKGRALILKNGAVRYE